MKRSRLYRKRESQIKKSFILSFIGIVAVIFVILNYGIPFLVNFTLFISGSQNEKNEPGKKENFISSPILDALPQATNSATIKITGKTQPKYEVKLYINDNLIDKIEADKNGSFSFKNVRLSSGENVIKTQAIKYNDESAFSAENTILFKSYPPSLSVEAPQDQKVFSKDENTISVSGKTDPESNVTVNGFWAIVNSDGTFSYTLTLSNGENKIVTIAQDNAGNKTEDIRSVTYNQ